MKKALAALPDRRAAGCALLIYHRVGGGSREELDVPLPDFRAQLDRLADHRVQALDEVVDRARDDAGPKDADRPSVVLTFDDGFRDVYDHAWPLLRERRLPFTVYLTTGYVGGAMRWAGSTAREQGAPALTWDQLREMVASGLCTVGNHTHTHVRPERLSTDELDRCSELVERELGVTPRHFAYPWGVPVPRLQPELRARFRSAATGRLGRNHPDTDLLALRRVPVRRTDPLPFFTAKLERGLLAERAYATVVAGAKRAGVRG